MITGLLRRFLVDCVHAVLSTLARLALVVSTGKFCRTVLPAQFHTGVSDFTACLFIMNIKERNRTQQREKIRDI